MADDHRPVAKPDGNGGTNDLVRLWHDPQEEALVGGDPDLAVRHGDGIADIGDP